MDDLRPFSALSMDCYGTLIDWETGIWQALQPLLARAPPSGRDVGRAELLAAFARHESASQAQAPGDRYPAILEAVHQGLAAELGIGTTDELDRAFGLSVGEWPAFSDSAESLRRLQRHVHLIILSNVDRASFDRSQARLGVDFDAVYTAEDVGSFKPAPANFEFLIAQARSDLDLEPDELLHTAQSLFHDHVPATAAGLATAWIDRQRLSAGGEWGATAVVTERPRTDFVLFSMSELADAFDAARA